MSPNIEKLITQKEYSLKQILEFTFYELDHSSEDNCTIDELRVFAKTERDLDNPNPQTVVILEKYAEYLWDEDSNIDEDVYDEMYGEGYTQFVLDNKLHLMYNGELFVDVVSSFKDYRKELNADLLVKALEHYSKRDCFLEITDDM